ncbi:MupA/Atu3671 family FMN-dependent luciferase-like monooxygenase [Sphingomonas molluscorum]|uniref:MupA/Atu3671 family FMN-dependent luciferase-like monooxygenase n=1 Tax=Sphingomonas molluscorum TaxID=418184 RepID=UPI0031DA6683
MDFSLMFFSGGEGRSAIDSYEDIREIAEFGDRHGFRRVWLPERHFQSFGALHPNPSVLAAYLAASTDTIRIAAGSVVAPLHDPLRIAEEWSVVDNLSRGRIDVALASGWLKSDFVFAPDAYEDRHRLLGERVRELRSLWRGNRAERQGGGGDRASVRVYPTAVQPELPLWVTAARNPETFRLAGALGANVLTYFVDLGLEGLANAVELYREARREAGFDPATGVVTVMLHAFVGEDSAATHRRVAQPYREYLLRNGDLLHQGGRNNALLTPRNLEELADVQLTRVYERLSLLGSVEAGLATTARLGEIGVNEIACLVDFLDDMALVKEALPMLAALKERTAFSAMASPTPARALESEWQAGADDFYAYIRSIGGEYGEKFRLIERVSLRGNEAISHMRAPAAGRGAEAILVDAIISTGHAFGLRPGLRGSSMPLALPAEVGSITIGTLSAEGFRVETRAKGRCDNLEYFDAVATAPNGEVVAQITDFAFQRLVLPPNDKRIRVAGDAVFVPGWTRLPIAGSPPREKRFTLTAPTPQLADAWTAALSRQGLNVATAPGFGPGPAEADHILLAHEPGPWRMGDAAGPRAGVARIASWVADLRSRSPGAKLVILVSGANAVLEGDPLPNAIAAAAWAAGGSMSLGGGEVRVIDLDPSRSIEEMAGGLAGLLHAPIPMASMRGEAVYVPGMVRDAKAAGHADRARPAVLAGRSVLVTGGTGALGQAVVEWAAEEGASNVSIVARRSAAFEQRIERGTIGEIRGSIADPKLWTDAEAGQDFDTVFHLAGIDPGEAGGDMAEAIDHAFEPKLDGLLNLRPLLERGRPCHLVLFSSVAALAGSYGQAAYAAANAAMAAAAQHLVDGTPHRATILHFGPWQGGGMAASSALDAAFAAKGVGRIEPWVALRAMGMLLPKPGGSWIVGRFDEARVQHGAAPAAAAAGEERGDTDGNILLATFKALSDAGKRDLLHTKIRSYAADIMEVAEDEIDLDANLFDMGFDSLMALEMRNALSLDYGIEVGLGVLMDARTLAQVADAILPVIEAAAAGKPVRRDLDVANIDIVL